MADNQEKTTIRKSDIEDVAGKLAAFAEGLPEQERNVLGLILTRAAVADDEDVTGYVFGPSLAGGFSSPFANQLGASTGFARPGSAASGTGSINVGWTYKFGGEMGGNQSMGALR